MNQNQLRELLHRSGERIQVGPPPRSTLEHLARRRRHRRTSILAVAALVAVIATGGAVLQGNLLDGNVAVTSPDQTQPRLVSVPALIGIQAEEARATLRDHGLRMNVDRRIGSVCLPERQVITQEPTPGSEVPVGTKVTAEVNEWLPGHQCGLDLPPPPEGTEQVAKRFLQFAEGQRQDPYVYSRPPGDDPTPVPPVSLYVGGEPVKTIPSHRLGDREAWAGCPEGGYAERSCPISALTGFVAYPGPVAFTPRAPSRPCTSSVELPDRLDAYRVVALTPDEGKDCTSYFAVELFVNDADEIVAVNVLLGSP